MNILRKMTNKYYKFCSINCIIKLLDYYSDDYNYVNFLEEYLSEKYEEVRTTSKCKIITFFYKKYNELPSFIVNYILNSIVFNDSINEYVNHTYPEILEMYNIQLAEIIISEELNSDFNIEFWKKYFINDLLIKGWFYENLTDIQYSYSEIKEIFEFLRDTNKLNSYDCNEIIQIYFILDKLKNGEVEFGYKDKNYKLTLDMIDSQLIVIPKLTITISSYNIIEKNINNVESLLDVLSNICDEFFENYETLDFCNLTKIYNGYFDENKFNYFSQNYSNNFVLKPELESYYFFKQINEGYLFSFLELKDFYYKFRIEEGRDITFNKIIFPYINIDVCDLENCSIEELDFIKVGYFKYIEKLI